MKTLERESVERIEKSYAGAFGNESRADAEMKIEKHCSLFNKMEATGDHCNSCLGECRSQKPDWSVWRSDWGRKIWIILSRSLVLKSRRKMGQLL